MIEVTDEMLNAYEIAAGRAFGQPTQGSFVGLAAVLAIVERDYCLERRGHVWHPLDKAPPTPPKKCGSTRWGLSCELPDGHPRGHRRSTWQAWS